VSACAAPARRDRDRYINKKDRVSLVADLHEQGGTPSVVFENEELLNMILNLLHADYRVCESFQYEKLEELPCPIHVLAGTNDSIESERLEAWQLETQSEFSLQWFDGGHFFIRSHESTILSYLNDLKVR